MLQHKNFLLQKLHMLRSLFMKKQKGILKRNFLIKDLQKYQLDKYYSKLDLFHWTYKNLMNLQWQKYWNIKQNNSYLSIFDKEQQLDIFNNIHHYNETLKEIHIHLHKF